MTEARENAKGLARVRGGAGGAKRPAGKSAANRSGAKKRGGKPAAKKSVANKPAASDPAGKPAAKKSAAKKSGAEKPGARKNVEIVDGGRYVLIDGRRWRATDPGIAEAERVRLVGELMRARRDVGRALRAGDAEAEREARARVHAAKVALGERGEKWWERGGAAQKK